MTAEQRARDDAIVMLAMPGTLEEIAMRISGVECWAWVTETQISDAHAHLSRLKRAGKARFNGKGWEEVR